MINSKRFLAALVWMLTMACPLVSAWSVSTPTRITVQGRLTDAGGVPAPEGDKTFTFRIFDLQTFGTEIWPISPMEVQTVHTDPNGLWTAQLGEDKSLDASVFKEPTRWLEITVDDGINSPETLSRIAINTTPYAYRVATVDGADGGEVQDTMGVRDPGGNVAVYGANGVSFSASGGAMTGPQGISFANAADDTALVVRTFADWKGGVIDMRGDTGTVEFMPHPNWNRQLLLTTADAWPGDSVNWHGPTLVMRGAGNSGIRRFGAVSPAGIRSQNDEGGLWRELLLTTADVPLAFPDTLPGPVLRLRDSTSGGENVLALSPTGFRILRPNDAGPIILFTADTLDFRTTVSIGIGNTVSGANALASGGENTASGDYAIALGRQARATAIQSAVGGGWDNEASGDRSVVSGGLSNTASGPLSVVSGGHSNNATADWSSVGGGDGNTASGMQSTVSGGLNNTASNFRSTISGGGSHTCSGSDATVGGGFANHATGGSTTVGGGNLNTASGLRATVGGGFSNVASGESATIPGGAENVAVGSKSFAAGFRAKANHSGAIVIAAAQGNPDSVRSGGGSQIVLRADSGMFITNSSGVAPYTPTTRLINTSTGAYLSSGGTWTNASDISLKENFTAIDRAALLEQVATLPITRWNYRSEGASVQHIGPTAQDFAAAFNVGSDDKSISTIDPAGVALAAIQSLYAKQKEENEELRTQIAELREMIRAQAKNQE